MSLQRISWAEQILPLRPPNVAFFDCFNPFCFHILLIVAVTCVQTAWESVALGRKCAHIVAAWSRLLASKHGVDSCHYFI